MGCRIEIKSFQSGQRFTPVINAWGLIQLLWILPGKRAARFLEQSADILVRYLGGGNHSYDEIFFFVVDTEVLIFLDESLVEEVQRNKQVAEDDITSTQAFMQSSFTSSNRTLVNDMNIESEQLSQVQNEPKEGTLAYQRMQAEIDQMVIANITARSLAKLQHVQHSTEAYNDFKNFIDDNDFQDPRIKQDLYDTNINMLNEAMGVKPHTLSNLTSSSETRDVVESNLPRYYTIDQVAVQHLGLKSLSTQQKSIMGRKAKKLWKESYPTEASKQVYKYVDGEQRAVNCYPQKHVEKMKQIILEHCEN